jgi:hypothetical protein
VEEKKVEPEEEEEDNTLTLEEFMKQKKGTTIGKKEGRKPEEMKKTNIEKGQEKIKQTT